MMWTTVDTVALRLWLTRSGVDIPEKAAFTRWAASRGLHPVGMERHGRSTTATWRMDDVYALVDRLTCDVEPVYK